MHGLDVRHGSGDGHEGENGVTNAPAEVENDGHGTQHAIPCGIEAITHSGTLSGPTLHKTRFIISEAVGTFYVTNTVIRRLIRGPLIRGPLNESNLDHPRPG